jgi:hypothetical protein
MVKIRGRGELYCERCKKWFFSRKYAEFEEMPKQCPYCKSLSWMKERKKKG